MSKKKIEKWYDNGYVIVGLIILTIFLMVISSQSFANSELSFALFSSVINHNSVYLLVLVYFIFLNFSFGKKYFNYLNAFLISIYLITAVTSFLTVVQSFSLATFLTFILHFVLFVYLSHTLLRGTRFWKEFHLSSSPFNELTNDGVFYAVVVISVFLLAVNLISTVVIRGVVIAVLEAAYYLLLGRYIYLYGKYLDSHNIDSNNEGNFNEVRGKVQKVLDKTEIDDVIVESIKSVKEVVAEDTKRTKKSTKKNVEKGE